MKLRMKLNAMLISHTGTYGLITVQKLEIVTHCVLLKYGFFGIVFFMLLG